MSSQKKRKKKKKNKKKSVQNVNIQNSKIENGKKGKSAQNVEKEGKEKKEKDKNKEEKNNKNKVIDEQKEKNKKAKILKIAIRTLIAFIILLTIYMSYFIIHKSQNKKNVFDGIENKEAYLTEYIVYGTNLNIKGSLNLDETDVKNVSLSLKTTDEINDKEEKLKFSKEGNDINFYLSELINEGLDLETLNTDKYYLFIKVEFEKGKDRYYSIKNQTTYEDVDYYTITKNRKNNKIDIKFDTYNLEDENISYMYITVKDTKPPKEVYDIVLDPGHGGIDVGAQGSGYNESDLVMKFSLKIKEELEKLGLKVRLTRDGTEGNEFSGRNIYNKDGRVNITGDSKAKYVFSIHLNSCEIPDSHSGVEIYAPPKANLTFAKSLADNIVTYGKTDYSTNSFVNYKVDDGIYVRTFSESVIEHTNKEAIEGGYEPYNVSEETPYLFMIRETGGIATKAYTDGRNTEYGKNLYYNSNIGVEAYLLELGYINNSQEVENIINNESGYVNGIVNAIKNEIFGNNESEDINN